MSAESFAVGDTVQVWMTYAEPSAWYTGKVGAVRPHYNWTDETWIEVSGDEPKPFVTTKKAKNARLAD